MLGNAFGQFDDAGRTFRVTNPDAPMPWVNVVCNGRYGFVVSHNGGGFCWYDDAQHCVLSRWEMDLVRDASGRFLYLADLDDGRVWSVAPSPCRPKYDRYECLHAQGWTRFTTEHAGIRSVWTLAAAPNEPVEVWTIELTNTGKMPRRLRVSSYFEWCCGVAPDAKREFHRLFFDTTSVERVGWRAIVATKNMWDIPPKSERDHWNQPWPYAAAHAVVGAFDRPLAIGDKSRFLGRYGSPQDPAAMGGPAPAQGGFGRFADPVAALGGDVSLGAGASLKLHYVIAIGANEAEALARVESYAPASRAWRVRDEAAAAWEAFLEPARVRSERAEFDSLNSTWLPYQAISGRLWGRTGYYQQSGARGFRDQLQDSQVWLARDPARTREQILLHATRQFKDGTVNHWWHALADFGNHTACSDDYLWLPFMAAAYLRDSGDASILEAPVAWRDDTKAAPIAEHALRAIRRALARLSPRGIPLIGSCDWNDGLSALGVAGKGESVWLAWFLGTVLAEWAEVAERHLRDDALATELRGHRERLLAAANAHAWDGAWYRYGTKDSGEWIGSAACREGQIHLNAQTWAILSGAAPADRAARAWASVKDRLLSPYGPLLLAPAYQTPDADVGYITRYSPGSRENGGVYMHAATWALMAACRLREPGTVGRIWSSIAPPLRARDAEAYAAEPYVLPGNVDGPLSDKPGRAGWTWYTGSAAWLNRVSLEWIMGLRPTWEGLAIDPCPFEELGRASATRVYRGRSVTVSFDSREFCRAIARNGSPRATLSVNGREIEGAVLTPEILDALPGGPIHVEASWAETPGRPKVGAEVKPGSRAAGTRR